MWEKDGYAGFPRRAGGYVLDSLISGLLFSPFLLAMRLSGGWVEDRIDSGALFTWGVPGYVLVLGLIVYLEGEKGWTPGKRILGMRVEDANRGGTIGWPRALLRRFAFLVSALPFYLGFLWSIWDRRRQAFHDKIVRSVVVVPGARAGVGSRP